jgi:uncharacterized protein (DUF1684 family)
MDEPELDPLVIADWRRRIAELYARIRAMPDPAEAHAIWRSTREQLYREHPASPVPAEKRSGFRAIHFGYDPSWRFVVPLSREAEPVAARSGGAASIELPISTGQPRRFDRIGWLQIPLPGTARRLALFWLAEYSGGLFLAFRDATNGRETYGGGRYLLDTGKGSDLGGDAGSGIVVVDFNFAYQPSCAFDPRWSCPLAAPENRLDVAVPAGERIT